MPSRPLVIGRLARADLVADEKSERIEVLEEDIHDANDDHQTTSDKAM